MSPFAKFIRLYGLTEYQRVHRLARRYFKRTNPERSMKGMVLHCYGERPEDYFDPKKYALISRATHMRLNWLTRRNMDA